MFLISIKSIISLKKKKKEALCAALLTTQRKQMALFGCILMWSEWTLLSKQLDLNRRLFEGSTIAECPAQPVSSIDKNKFYFFDFYARTPHIIYNIYIRIILLYTY